MAKDLDALDAMLPSSLGVYPGLCITGRYVLSRDTERHHGNGLKAFRLTDDRIVVAVVDTGLRGAAAATGAVRLMAVMRGQLESGSELEQALTAVHRYASRSGAEAGATMVVAVVDPADGRCEIGSAGHPPPLLLCHDGTVRALDVPASRPLGLGGSPTVTSLVLELGDALLLHTDGLLTAGSGDLHDGSEELLGMLATNAPRRSVGPMYGDAVAEHVLGRMQHPNGFVDDVALLIVQRRTPPEPFHMSGRAEDDEDARVLTRFGQWLDALGVGLLDHVALGGALREVLASVMSHAERERHGDRRFAVEATLGTDAVVRLRVSDSNRWRAEDGARGPGLVVAGGLVDHLRLHHTADGTDVIMEQAIGRPVPLLQSQAVDSGTGRPVPDLTGPSDLAVSVGAGHAEVAGAIGVDEIEAFRETVHEATLAGTLPATIDLGGVTRLGGPAVRVLFEYLERANESGVSFRVVVDPGSAADHFLTQTDMPHEVRDPEGSPEDGDQ